MNQKNETETDKPDKTPGQVGYEAMLGKMLRDGENPEWVNAEHNLWANQAPKLREDWENVGNAIITLRVSNAHSALRKAEERELKTLQEFDELTAEIEKLRAELAETKHLLEHHEMNIAIIKDRDREVADLQQQLDGAELELGHYKHLLAEERALTAACAGKVST